MLETLSKLIAESATNCARHERLGTSNNDDFVGSSAAVARRSFSVLIFRGSGCVYAIQVPFYAYRAHDTIMRRPFAPA